MSWEQIPKAYRDTAFAVAAELHPRPEGVLSAKNSIARAQVAGRGAAILMNAEQIVNSFEGIQELEEAFFALGERKFFEKEQQ